ncbi:MAG TPA: STAS domain-containing protein [Ilumatobacteraceae bacterium]|jgi:anti-anti-sigma factor
MHDDALIVTIRSVGGTTVAKVSGEIDAHSAPGLLMTLDQMLDPAGRGFIDLSRVTFLDSSGLRILVLQLMRFEEAGGQLEISAASSVVHRVVSVAGLTEVFGLPEDPHSVQ